MDMIFLLDFSPIKPDFGLFAWTAFTFIIFWLMMAKFAFGPIKDSLKTRNSDIQDALDQAAKAKEEMANLKSENEKILAQAREERSAILREAKEAKDKIINDAKDTAKLEANKIMESAQLEIGNQRKAAMTEVKNMTGLMAIEIAEKVLRKDLKGDSSQNDLVNSLVGELKLN